MVQITNLVSDCKSFDFEVDKERVAVNKHMAARIGYKPGQQAGSFVRKNTGEKIWTFLGASRRNAIDQKSSWESGHMATAAMARAMVNAQNLPQADLKETLRLDPRMRASLYRSDFMTFRQGFHSGENGASFAHRLANRLHRCAYWFGGAAEATAAPTGFIHNMFRNLVLSDGLSDSRLASKGLYVGSLLFIGLLGAVILDSIRNAGPAKISKHILASAPKKIGATLVNFAVSFPMISATMGFLSFATHMLAKGVAALGGNPEVSDRQLRNLADNSSKTMRRITDLVLRAKEKPETLKVLCKALGRKPGLRTASISRSDFIDSQGVPKLVDHLMKAVDKNACTQANIDAAFNVVGQYLNEGQTTEAGFKQRDYTRREGHFLALASMVEHGNVLGEEFKDNLDLRRKLENKLKSGRQFVATRTEKFIHWTDKKYDTRLGNLIKDYHSPERMAAYKAKLKNPALAARHCNKTDYVYANLREYKWVARKCFQWSEHFRQFGMNIALARNAQISRLCDNVFKRLYSVATGRRVSRSPCVGMGRAAGGVALSAATAFGVNPLIAEVADPLKIGNLVKSNDDTKMINWTGAGTQMWLFFVPSYALQLVGHTLVAAGMGWKGPKLHPENLARIQLST